MEYVRIQSIDDPLFAKMHQLMSQVFPPEEVLEFSLWREPLQDPSIHVYVALDGDEVVGTTEYRYYPDMQVAMTDFTIIGKPAMGIGRFLLRKREQDIARLAEQSGTVPIGMFAEIYNPLEIDYEFGGVTPMNPYVRREVLSHIGYKKTNLSYVHPSWDLQGDAVSGLDLCFLPADEDQQQLDAALIVQFLETYYSAIANKPAEWLAMVEQLRTRATVELLPI